MTELGRGNEEREEKIQDRKRIRTEKQEQNVGAGTLLTEFRKRSIRGGFKTREEGEV